MSTPLVCLGIAAVLAYLPRFASRVRPRSPRAETFDALARDGFEALVAFAVAVVAVQAAADPHRAGILSIAFVVTRGGWLAAHAVEVDFLRAALWGLGLLLTGALFSLAWMTYGD
jgi:uncharacterized MAPEG superfamily protein